ncbi:MAG: F0F1 ATP synthase subunit A [Planctomycetes bacterium]|nr:F0F1 ATP synthase subunit A [Planctomycetota bacterium]
MSFAPLLILAEEQKMDPVAHVVNHPFLKSDSGLWLWSAQTGSLVLSAILTVIVLYWAAGKIATGPASEGTNRYVTRNPFAHAIEVICNYLRDTIARPLLGERTDRFIPFLWSVFFFILFNNILGLVPILDLIALVGPESWHHNHMAPVGGTATQNLFVTGALALTSALVINISGMRELGIGGYVKHLTAGTPAYLWPLMVPIELLSTFIKPVALALRLFANMTAGHILMAVLFGFAGMGLSGAMSYAVGAPVTLISCIANVLIYFLELFVAFLQAFVFMFLTTVFISQLSHHHDHEHDDAHGHEHAHA